MIHANIAAGPRVLVDAFNEDQAERYNMFRRIKLRKETVRKVCHVPPADLIYASLFQ